MFCQSLVRLKKNYTKFCSLEVNSLSIFIKIIEESVILLRNNYPCFLMHCLYIVVNMQL